MTAIPEPNDKVVEVTNLPSTLADEISKLDPLAIARESKATEEQVRTRLTRLVQKANETEADVAAGKHRESIDIFYDNGLIVPGSIDAHVINALENQYGVKEGFDPSLEAIYRDIPGKIQGVRQAIPIEGRMIKDKKGDDWKPAICYHQSFEISGIGYSENKPGQLVKSLSFIKVPNNQPAKTP